MMKAEPVADVTRNTHNYFAQGGNELVIGGKLTFLPGAVIEGGKQKSQFRRSHNPLRLAVAKLFFNWVRADTSIESARFVSSEYCARLSVPDFNPEATADSARNTVENIRDIINIRFMLIRAPPADFLVLSKDLFSFLVCFSDTFAPLW